MANILVTGNGFDLAHGLKTSYSDFINIAITLQYFESIGVLSLSENSGYKIIFSLEDFERKYEEFRGCSLFNADKFYNFLKEDSEESFKYIDISLNNYFSQVVSEYKDEKYENWQDYEYILEQHINALGFLNYKMDYINNDYTFSEYVLELSNIFKRYKATTDNKFQYIQFVKKELLNELNNLKWLLCKYLDQVIDNDYNAHKFFFNLQLKYVINFNYTDTFKKIYASYRNEIELLEIDNIHGSLVDGYENLVFGISDVLKEIDKNSVMFIEFQKYYQRCAYGSGEKYKKWIKKESLEEINLIYYGHSLSKNDEEVLKFFLKYKNITVHILCHGQEAKKSITKNLVETLAPDIFKQEIGEGRIEIGLDDDEYFKNKIIEKCQNSNKKNKTGGCFY